MNEKELTYDEYLAAFGESADRRLYHEAKCAMSNGEYSKASNILIEQVRLFPPPVGLTCHMIGECLFMQEKYAESILYFAAAVGLNDKQEHSLYFLARALIQLGDLRRALNMLQRAHGINPAKKKILALRDEIFQRDPSMREDWG